MSRLLRLYPPRWRARYEAEFRALLEQQQPSLGDHLDILRGAILAWLNPRHGRGVRRSAFWLILAAAIAAGAAPVVGTFESTPAQASPRYPVTLSLGPDVQVNTLQFVVDGVQRTVPHLVLEVDSHGSWLLTGVITERSAVRGTVRPTRVPEVENSAWRHAWDFGRIRSGQVVWLTLDLRVLNKRNFIYSINGYGALARDGKPDMSVLLTNPAAQADGTMHFGTVGPSSYSFTYLPEPGCGDQPRHGYHVCTVESMGQDFRISDFRNDGRAIPDFVLKIDSLGSWTLAGVTASMWHGGTPRLFTPRVLPSRRFVYTLGFGRVPHGVHLHVHLGIVFTGLSAFRDRESVFGKVTPRGEPDPRALVFTGADSLT